MLSLHRHSMDSAPAASPPHARTQIPGGASLPSGTAAVLGLSLNETTGCHSLLASTRSSDGRLSLHSFRVDPFGLGGAGQGGGADLALQWTAEVPARAGGGGGGASVSAPFFTPRIVDAVFYLRWAGEGRFSQLVQPASGPPLPWCA